MTIVPAGPSAAPLTGQQAKLMKAAHDLEAVFYGQLFQAMRQAVPEGGMFEHSTGEQMFTSMMDDQVAQLASNQTDRGLADALYRQLNRLLPPASAPAAAPATSDAAGVAK